MLGFGFLMELVLSVMEEERGTWESRCLLCRDLEHGFI